LWIEEHPEVTEAGKSRAIPAEWVRCVFEVKSRFRRATVQAAVEHLLDLKPLFQKPNIDDRYASWINDNFFCGVIFFELAQADVRDATAIKAMMPEELPKNFLGGIILRGEGISDPDASARIQPVKAAEPGSGSEILQGSASLLQYVFYIENIARGVEPEHPYLGMFMSWSPFVFSTFAFDIIALLTGTYRTGFVSSFHASWVAAAAASPTDEGSS
jgi:hypothetical protein